MEGELSTSLIAFGAAMADGGGSGATPSGKYLLVLVGLPARGKSTVANKLRSFLLWRGFACRTFNVGEARRKDVPTTVGASSAFFSTSNAEAKAVREALAMGVLHTALHFLAFQGGNVAILDATNSTRARRRAILASVLAWRDGEHEKANAASPPAPSSVVARQKAGLTPHVLFIENVCNDARVLASNMLQKVLNSPDYASLPVEAALTDLQARIREYETVYETVDEALEDAGSPLGPIAYIKLIDLSSKVVCRNIPGGALAFSIVSYLMVLHVGARPLWLVRAGQVTSEAVRAVMAARSRTTMRASLGGGGGSSSDAEGGGGSFSLLPSPSVQEVGADVSSAARTSGSASFGQPVPLNVAMMSNALLLNENGRRFAEMLCDFVLRRTAGGRLRQSKADPPDGRCGGVRRSTRRSGGEGGEAQVGRALSSLPPGGAADVSLDLSERLVSLSAALQHPPLLAPAANAANGHGSGRTVLHLREDSTMVPHRLSISRTGGSARGDGAATSEAPGLSSPRSDLPPPGTGSLSKASSGLHPSRSAPAQLHGGGGAAGADGERFMRTQDASRSPPERATSSAPSSGAQQQSTPQLALRVSVRLEKVEDPSGAVWKVQQRRGGSRGPRVRSGTAGSAGSPTSGARTPCGGSSSLTPGGGEGEGVTAHHSASSGGLNGDDGSTAGDADEYASEEEGVSVSSVRVVSGHYNLAAGSTARPALEPAALAKGDDRAAHGVLEEDNLLTVFDCDPAVYTSLLPRTIETAGELR